MKNIYQDVTNRIIAELEKGCAPWVKPWSASSGVPMNAVSKRPYSGVNVLLLWLAMDVGAYAYSRWLTFKQAKDAGLHIRKGEKGVRVVFVKNRMDSTVDDNEDESISKIVHIMRSFVVFNIQQCEGDEAVLKKLHHPGLVKPLWKDGDQYELAYRIFEDSGAKKVTGSKACYMPEKNVIAMPTLDAFMEKAKEAGGDIRRTHRNPAYNAYFATLFHEMTHWTGHESRLDRDLTGRFGDASYAAEELIAEIGSAFTCAHAGIAGQLQHASYIKSWLELLKSDDRAIFTAASKAQQACDFLLSMQEEQKQVQAA